MYFLFETNHVNSISDLTIKKKVFCIPRFKYILYFIRKTRCILCLNTRRGGGGIFPNPADNTNDFFVTPT